MIQNHLDDSEPHDPGLTVETVDVLHHDLISTTTRIVTASCRLNGAG